MLVAFSSNRQLPRSASIRYFTASGLLVALASLLAMIAIEPPDAVTLASIAGGTSTAGAPSTGAEPFVMAVGRGLFTFEHADNGEAIVSVKASHGGSVPKRARM
jgi:hypothetical protein